MQFLQGLIFWLWGYQDGRDSMGLGIGHTSLLGHVFLDWVRLSRQRVQALVGGRRQRQPQQLYVPLLQYNHYDDEVGCELSCCISEKGLVPRGTNPYCSTTIGAYGTTECASSYAAADASHRRDTASTGRLVRVCISFGVRHSDVFIQPQRA